MKIKTVLLFLFLFVTIKSQVLTWEPVYFTEDSAVTITFDATKGNAGLAGETGTVYAHTGVLIVNSTSNSDWYAAPQWLNNDDRYKLTRIGDDLYEFTITPSVFEFYTNAPTEKPIDASDEITHLAFVFRNADGSSEGKGEGNSDIFIELRTGVSIVSPDERPYQAQLNETIPVTAIGSSITDTLKLFVGDEIVETTLEDTLNYSITADQFKEWVKVIGTTNLGISVVDSFYYYVNPEVTVQDPPVDVIDGINYHDDERSVTLSLYAVDKDYIYVIGDFNNWEIDPDYYMNRSTNGATYWLTVENLNIGQEYAFQYFVDGELKIADPYTDKVLDPWNDSFIPDSVYPDLRPYPSNKTEGIVSVFQTAKPNFDWEIENFDRPSKEKLVIYELLVRDFVSTHSYQALIDTLSYLKSLGINAIELMPVSEFEGNSSWGYNPSFYFAPDKYYGTEFDLKEFIDACHKEGIAVILDIVLNHAFGQNPMVQLYFDRYDSQTGEIIMEEGNPYFNVRSPNRSFFWGADFNHQSQFTKTFTKRVLEHWLTEYKFDGFRFDFTKGFTNKSGDGWAYDASRIAILKDYADHIWSVESDAYVILEHLTENSEEKELSDYDMLLWGNLNYNYNEATMGYHDNNKSDFSSISYKQRSWNYPHLIGYMESHDEERLMYKNLQYGNSSGDYDITKLNVALQRVKLAGAFFFTIPGPKMIWQFGELGYDYSIDYNDRVGEKPIRWDYLNNVNRVKLYKTFNALIKLRDYEAFHTDDFIIGAANAVKRIRLNHDSMNINIIGNFDITQRTTSAVFQNTGWWYDYFSGDSIEVTDINMSLSLDAGEFHIYTTEKLPTPENGLLTDIKEFEENIPSSYSLLQNYPNPFNPSTTIKFTIPQSGFVSLKVYNILGQEVKTLLSKEISTGVYNVDWNGTNNYGDQLSSGVYFYRIEAGDFIQTRKMLFIK